MKKKKIQASVLQTLELEDGATIEKCPDREFSYLDCIKIGGTYFLPSIEWTKYVPAKSAAEDDSCFEPIEGADWEALHHAIVDEQTQVRKA